MLSITYISSLALAIAVLQQLASADCAADNCLRAFRATQTPGRLSSAQAFCATFTQSTVTATTALPSYAAAACTGNVVSRVSSVCSCIAPAASKTTMTTAVASTSAATVANACATVSSLSAAAKLAAPAATPLVPAQLAYDCLNSVPLNTSAAIDLVNAMMPYIEWQSDIAYLATPPPTYFYPPDDVVGMLNLVLANLKNNVYSNEYEFQVDLYAPFAKAHDGHFVFYPDILTRAFEWGRQVAVVSLSRDGSDIPKIYAYEDVIASSTLPSALTAIDGQEASTYIANYAYTASFNQDADAAYNTMFFEKAFEAGSMGLGYFHNAGRVRYIYPGANTTFTFANGTSYTIANVAHVKGNFSGVVDGPSFYKKFAGTQATNAAAAAATPAAAPAVPQPSGYPPPVVSTNDTIVSGYYLSGEGLNDVAVLSVLAFESESPVEFQAVAQQFITDAKAAGKKKMIVDLSANGGGYILQGYDLFRQFFPTITQDGYSRIRENDMMLTIAEIVNTSIPADYDPKTASDFTIQEYESFFNWRYDYNISNVPFSSFNDKFYPHVYERTPYTSIIRWNFNDPLTTVNSTYGFGTEITGYGDRSNFTQPFAAEDIILLYDGYCASTCTIFSEGMRLNAGVKSVAMGGRPNKKAIQGVGGIKGSQSLGWADVLGYAQLVLPNATAAQGAILNQLTELPISRSSSNGINLRDQILRGNVLDGEPAQFVVEDADCRLFYTAPMVKDVTALWAAVANAAWNGAKCVNGGISHTKSERTVSMGEKRDAQFDNIHARPRTTISERDARIEALARRALFRRAEIEKATDPFWEAKYLQKAIP